MIAEIRLLDYMVAFVDAPCHSCGITQVCMSLRLANGIGHGVKLCPECSAGVVFTLENRYVIAEMLAAKSN